MLEANILEFLFLAAVVTFAFAVRSGAGFGSAVIAVPLSALVLPVQAVIPIIASLQLVSTIEYGVRTWREVAWRELLRIAPYMVGGVFIGLYFFSKLDDEVIRKALGVFVIVYAAWVLATATRDTGAPRRPTWALSAVLSTAGGMIGALFGGAGSPFYAMYLRALRLSRDSFRATMSMILLMQVTLRVAGYGSLGLVDAAAVTMALFALPCVLVGGRLGERVAARMDQQTFSRVLATVLLGTGAALAFR